MTSRTTCILLVALVVGRGARGEDCNGNGLDDAEELAAGRNADCDQNGIPDECDRASGLRLEVEASGELPNFVRTLSRAIDLDDDGDLDFVIGRDAGAVSVLLNDGDLGFTEGEVYSPQMNPTGVHVADWDGDERPDIVVSFLGVSHPSYAPVTLKLSE